MLYNTGCDKPIHCMLICREKKMLYWNQCVHCMLICREKKLLYKTGFDKPIHCMMGLPSDLDSTQRTVLLGFADGVVRAVMQCSDAWKVTARFKPHSGMSLHDGQMSCHVAESRHPTEWAGQFAQQSALILSLLAHATTVKVCIKQSANGGHHLASNFLVQGCCA